MSTARVLIADDHATVLDALITLLRDHFEVVAAVSDGHLLVEAATRLHPDVIVTDISMPGLNGVQALKRLRSAGVDAKIIILTLHADAEVAAEAMRAGASGFVLKLLAANELVTAVERVLIGQTYLTPSLQQ